MDLEEFLLLHEPQLKVSNVPEHLWPKLHQKLANESFDAGEYFTLICEEESEDESSAKKWQVLSNCQLHKDDKDAIFLVDHSWTFRAGEARESLDAVEGLAERMRDLMGIVEAEEEELDEDADRVLRHLWKFAQTYSVSSPGLKTEARMPVWYILDEFGSRIQHSDKPSVRLVPFFYHGTQMAFSLLFPILDIQEGMEVCRDFVEDSEYHRSDWRQFYLYPWCPADHSNLPYENVDVDDTFFTTGRGPETVPEVAKTPKFSSEQKLKVLTDDDQLVRFLRDPRFQLTSDQKEANVWWLREHFKDYKSLAENHPNTFINQFGNECLLTVKDLLAAVIQTAYRDSQTDVFLNHQPPWFQVAFNLRTELPNFISYFQNRGKRKLDNYWIIKPWNLARGLDIHISDDLAQIVRLIDSGPKIACKYIEDPVLFYREDLDSWIKFDLRFIVFLRAVRPLHAYVYNHYWLRFALKQFILGELDDYERHFTVFNYKDEGKILQMRHQEFEEKFEDQYPGFSWGKIREDINDMIREALEAASAQQPPKGLSANPQSRAMYGVDVMLKWTKDPTTALGKGIQPVLLEMNFMPDCQRACDYYPEFADSVFQTLFLDPPLANDSTRL